MSKLNLIFDLDGTLIDSIPGIESSIRTAIHEVIGEQDLPCLRPMIGPPVRVIFQNLFPDLAESTLSQVAERFRRMYDSEGWKLSQPFPGVLETLEALQMEGESLFIVTNKPSLPTKNILTFFGFSPFIQAWACRDSRTPPFASKQDVLQNMLDTVVDKTSINVYLGDQPEDCAVAQACGIRFIGVTYGYGDPARLEGCGNLQIDRFADLLSVTQLIKENA